MKRWIWTAGAAIIISLISYQATILYLPNLVYHRFYTQLSKDNQLANNEVSILLAPDETSRRVVMPNPDFAYAVTFFDLDEGPLRLKGSMPDSTYWSLALYQPNTVNFYIKNDLQYGDTVLDVLLASETIVGASQEQIISPQKKGLILFRVLIKDRSPARNSYILQKLETIRIEPYIN